MQDPVSIQVIERFFQAFDFLHTRQVERLGVNEFCSALNVDKRNFSKQRKNHTMGVIRLSWLVHLSARYNVSTEWLLLGTGSMISSNPQK